MLLTATLGDHVSPRIRAVRIEELRIGVVRGIARVEPNGIDPSIRRDRQRAEPVPFAVIDRIVVDPLRGAEGLSAVGAAHEHHVASGVEAGRLHARHHVNIVIRAGARTVRRQENLPDQSFRIYRIKVIDDAAHVDLRALVERLV